MREIPLAKRAKRARDRKWTTREYTAEEIADWRGRGLGYNVGFALEPGDLVVDIDPRNDPRNDADPTAVSADDMLRELDARFGMNLADTAPINVTGGGGLHVLLTMPPETVIRKRPFRENLGFEFKRVGTLIVAPGSVHPDTGLLYEVRRAGDLTPAPPALLEAIERPVSGKSGDGEILHLSQIERCLGVLDVQDFSDQDRWLELGMAIHSASGGSEEAKELWRDWSWSDAEYLGDETVLERWDSFSADGEITSGTFYKIVSRATGGGSVPAPDPADEFDVIEDDDPLTAGLPVIERAEWRLTGDPPKVRANLMHNVLEAARLLPHTFAFNELTHFPEMDGGDIQDYNLVEFIREISDVWQSFWTSDPPDRTVKAAFLAKARENRYHPIRDYIQTAEWDGKPRIDTWLSDFTEAEATRYVQGVGRLLLIAAVARVMEPGVKYDCMVVFEGYQGSGKSTLVRTLGGEWTAEGIEHQALTQASKAIEALHGKWFVEFDEMVATKKSDADHVKAFLSRTEDRARLAYGQFSAVHKRQIVMIGTTNDDEYLRDMTGNRRFLPVKVDKCDTDGVAQVRDQLFAEALHIWRAERPELAIPPDLRADAIDAVEARRMVSSLEDVIDRFLQENEKLTKIHSEALYTEAGRHVPSGDFGPKKIAEIMKKRGWAAGILKIDGIRLRGFRKIS